MENKLQEAFAMYQNNQVEQSLELVNQYIQENLSDYQAFLLRGRIHYRMQNWGDAMNDYALVLESDSENQEAKSGMEMVKNILGYFTPDLFNP